MANAYNGTTFVNIARMGITVFLKRMQPIINVFSMDLSADLMLQGETVTTRIVPASSAAQSLSAVHSGSRFAAAGDTTTVAVTTTLTEDPIVGFHLTDEEAMKIGAGVWQDTRQRLINTKVNALADDILNFTYNLITGANYTNIAFTGAASTFDLDDIVDINTTLSDADWPMGDEDVHMVLKSAYFDAVKKDSSVQSLDASGLPVVTSGDSGIAASAGRQIDDFRLHKATTLPPSGGTPESENLIGFVSRPQAMVLAMRAVQPQMPEKLMFFQILTDPGTGLTIVYRATYDDDKGRVNHTFEALYGATKADGAALQRMTSV